MKNFIRILLSVWIPISLCCCRQTGLYNIFPYKTQNEAKPYLGLRKVYHIENIDENDFNKEICKEEFFFRLGNSKDWNISLVFPTILPDSAFFPYSLHTNYFDNRYHSEYRLLNEYLKNFKIEIFDTKTNKLEANWRLDNDNVIRMKKDSGYAYQFSVFFSPSSGNIAKNKVELKQNRMYKILISNYLERQKQIPIEIVIGKLHPPYLSF